MKLKKLLDKEESSDRRGSIPEIPPDGEAASPANRKEKGKIPKDLVDELADYICGHVTKSLRPVQKAIEKRLIIRALREAGGNQREAAKILGLKHTTLNYKVRKHNIHIKKVVLSEPDQLFKGRGGDGE
jgi:transcriptional regulator with GAF, ATPase, and Fis domain